MRRADRAIQDMPEILAVMHACDVCRLGFVDEGVAHIVPLNFGIAPAGTNEKDAFPSLYFHSAATGYKLSLFEEGQLIAFEMDHGHELFVNDRGYCTMAYESVMGRGTLHTVTEEAEKMRGLTSLMEHHHPEDPYFDPRAVPITTVLRLDITEMTAKRKTLPHDE